MSLSTQHKELNREPLHTAGHINQEAKVYKDGLRAGVAQYHLAKELELLDISGHRAQKDLVVETSAIYPDFGGGIMYKGQRF